MGGNSSRDHGGTLFTGLLPLACSAPSFLHPKPTCLGMALLTVVLPNQSTIMKITYPQTCPQTNLIKGNASIEGPPSQVCLDLCEGYKTEVPQAPAALGGG